MQCPDPLKMIKGEVNEALIEEQEGEDLVAGEAEGEGGRERERMSL